MRLNNSVYDVLKWTTMVLLPAFGSFYFGLSQIWNFPYPQEVVGTVACTELFIGALIGISHASRDKTALEYDGELRVNSDDPSKDVYSFVLHGDVDDLTAKDDLRIKVSPRHLEDAQ